jgi:serine/threonine-protein kinase
MISSRSLILAALCTPLLCASPRAAHAEEAGTKAAAQALYDEAARLMLANDFAAACKKFEDSDRVFQGVGTRARLGECYAKLDRLASAWSTYRSALSAAETRGDPRAAELQRRAEALEPRLSRLRIEVPAEARVAGLTIVRGGLDVPAGLWGAAVPVDGGVHTIEASAPGRITRKTTVTVAPEKGSVEIVLLPLEKAAETAQAPSLPASPPPPPTTTSTPPAGPVAAAPPAPEQAVSRPQRTTGLVVGAFGLAGLGVGGFFGLQTISKKNASNADGHCNAASVCDPTGTSLRNDAKSSATLSTVFTTFGIAALAGGAVLFLSAPAETTSRGSLRVAPTLPLAENRGGISLLGSW